MLLSLSVLLTHESIITIFINKFCNKLREWTCQFSEQEGKKFPFECSHSIWEFHNSTQNYLDIHSMHATSENSISSVDAAFSRKNIMKNSFRRIYNSFHIWNIYSMPLQPSQTVLSRTRFKASHEHVILSVVQSLFLCNFSCCNCDGMEFNPVESTLV